jgi:L-ascorbate metabolism protein UlaG (beta-lactamase superfamily)
MRIRWHGQSAYTLKGAEVTVAIDPFGDLGALLGGGRRFAYPPVPEPVDLLFVPVGGGPTIGADQAAQITRALAPRWAVPMHYRTAAIDFLEPADEFLALQERVAESGPEHLLERNGAHGTTVLHMAPPEVRG